MEGPLRYVFSHPVFFGPLLKAVLPKMGGEARALVTSTCAFTMMNGSDKPNVLPEKAEMTANVRISTDDTLDSIRKALEKRAKPYAIDVECLMGQEPSPVSASSTPAYELIVRQIKAVYPNAKTAPYVMLASTDARHFTKISSQVFRFSPFIISTSQMAGIHGADENIYVDSLAHGVQFYHDLVYNTLPGT
jgi:carboxypeptidase PM20D1